MKGNRWFIGFVLAFIALVFAFQYRLPKKFVWNPTFSQYDEQPFGCALFDSLLTTSLPGGYSVSKKTFFQLMSDESTKRQGVLLVANNLSLTQADINALLTMAERGDKIMLAGTSFGHILEDTLRFSCSYSRFTPQVLKKMATSSPLKRDTICWTGDSGRYSPQIYRFFPPFCQSSFVRLDSVSVRKLAVTNKESSQWESKNDTLLHRKRKDFAVAFVRAWGKGEIILVSTPLVFTNYGVLDGKNVDYIFRLLSQMSPLPVVRLESYLKETAQDQQSPFRYFLSRQPLRWALYLAMAGIVLFMLFTAKRRQRVIPVVEEPVNRSLEFTQLIGSLYYQRRSHADLVQKKFVYFAEVLRREVQADIEVVAEDGHTFRRIARKTGMDAEEIGRFIRELRPVIYGGRDITVEDMKKYIDKMNEIIEHI